MNCVSKIKTLLLTFILFLAIPMPSYAQVTQDPEKPTLKSFEDDAVNIRHDIKGGLIKLAPLSLVALPPFIYRMILAYKGYAMRTVALTEVSGCGGFLIKMGVHPIFTFVSSVLALTWVASFFASGFSFMVIDQELAYFNEIPPFPAFECHIKSPVRYDGMITCNSTASFPNTNRDPLPGYISDDREWNFGDGRGFQKIIGPLANYTLPNPGNYTIQLRVTDNNNRQSTASFELNVPNSLSHPSYLDCLYD